jgi:hypothetical protein
LRRLEHAAVNKARQNLQRIGGDAAVEDRCDAGEMTGTDCSKRLRRVQVGLEILGGGGLRDE